MSPVPHPATVRSHLLAAARAFVRDARGLPGVDRIALIGSILTNKLEPKVIDLLVTIADAVDLRVLAGVGRRLKGATQQLNRGADIFVARHDGRYLGRTCSYRDCHPRRACGGTLCGQARYLRDDLDVVTLPASLALDPPVELWPRVRADGVVPADVAALLDQLRSDSTARPTAEPTPTRT
ncbi:MAG TPA: hypothetical protein VJM31_01300 [Vicinamibacterales bacterium]|nr:hypothetical protein [Vicinamibacterales bacterium]